MILINSKSFKYSSAALNNDLHVWDRTILKGPQKRINKLKKELEELRLGPMSDSALGRQQEILVALEALFEQEEIAWLQWGRADFLRKGDRNTEFFHRFATDRKRKNTIKTLTSDMGTVIEGNNELSDHISEYFSSLFTSEVVAPSEDMTNGIHPRVTTLMNEMLSNPYTAEEIKNALFSIGDMKAPG